VDMTLYIITLLGYNLLLVELLFIAFMAHRFNSTATNGSGGLLGPFAFILATIILRLDVSLLDLPITLGLVWRLLGVMQLWGAVSVGALVCEHMLGGVQEYRAGQRGEGTQR